MKQIRFEKHIDDNAKRARQGYEKLLQTDLVEVARADLEGLRDPRQLSGRSR